MQILSDIAEFPRDNLNNIEIVLAKTYGTILRWAIVDVSDDKIKISFSYTQP